MASTPPMYTTQQFNKLLPTLTVKLTAALQKELSDCALPELGREPDSDLWDLPTVDSKTVCKLSPIVKEVVGRSLKANWVRKGGYKNIDEAVEHVVDQLRKHCVVGAVASAAAIS